MVDGRKLFHEATVKYKKSTRMLWNLNHEKIIKDRETKIPPKVELCIYILKKTPKNVWASVIFFSNKQKNIL